MMIEIQNLDTTSPLWKEVRAIRDEVFVVEQEVSPEEEYDEFEESARHFLAFFEGLPAGTARWRFTTNGIKLERFAVKKEFRKHGVGAAIVQAVLNEVIPKAEKETQVYLHAQVQAIPFYEKASFETFGEEFVEADILHRKMRLIR
jgi:predicted GNAT family N-acyltransferase